MYPISEALRTRFENGERKRVTITLNNLTLKDLIITDADIVSDSLSIDRYCATGNKIEIGSAVSAELSLVLNNDDGRFDGIKFEGSELKVEIGIWGVANSDIPCGYFTVDEPPRAFSKIRLKALDFMMRFDKDADLTKIPFPCSVETVVRTISSLCDVVVSENINFDGFPNSGVMLYAPTTPNITYRQILQWVAQITGTCAYIDWDGKLRLSWFKSTSVNITPAIRYSGDMLENDISITGVAVKTGNGSFVSGTEDYALDIDGNELIYSGTEQQTANNVFNGVNDFKYRPYECSCIPMPYLYPLDKITYTDKNGNVIDTIITNHTFGLNSTSALAAQGETQQKKSYASQKGITKKDIDNAIAEAMKDVDLTAEKFYVKYSPYNGGKDANGNIVWSVTVTDDTVYIGTCATTESTAPADPTKYNWVRLKGVDGDSISTVKNYYLATSSASGVTTSTSGWTEAVQTPTSAKKYLWNYDEIIYTGSKTATKTTPCIVGVFGADGKGISSVTEYYLATSSSSGVTTSTSGWTTAIQTVTSSKKYLWNYEVIAYTSGNPTTTTPVIIGTYGDKGDKGDTGKGISGVVNYYLASSSSSGVTVSTSGWTEAIQTPTKDKKYLWNYEKVTYSDTTSTNTTPCIIGNFAEEGKEGVSISSVTEYYAKSSSQTTAPADSSFSTSVPTLDATDKYLWNYEKIEYTGGKSATTTPKCVIGVFGKDGTSQYVYVRYSANSNGSSMTSSPQSNTAYMGVCTTTSSTAPTSYTSYTWTKIKGEQGVGIPGTSSYTHIKYSNNGTTFTDGNGEELGSWIGILVDTNETDSSVFSDYTWKKFTDDVDSTLNDLDDRINKAVADIIKLNDRLATLVTDENGYSLMQQTSDGWTFNIGDVTGNVEKVAGDLKDLSDNFNGIVSSVDGLSDAIDDLGELASYVRVIQDNNKPCIELGKSDSDFKVKITNTDIKFMEGSTVVAYISNQALNIEKAVIKEELQVGGFALKKRSNGNVGFMWKGES